MTIVDNDIDISTIIGAAETPHLACCRLPDIKEFLCGAPFHEELLERGEGQKCPECLAILTEYTCPAVRGLPQHFHCIFAPRFRSAIGTCMRGPIGA